MNKRYIVSTSENLPDNITNEVGREIPVSLLKEAWVKSYQNNKQFAKRHALSVGKLEYLIEIGSWEELRAKHKETLYRTFAKGRLENIERRQELIEEVEGFELMALESVVEDIKNQFETEGHIFILDTEGKIRRDAFGNPMVRKVPEGLKEALQTTEKLREDNIEVLIAANTKALPKKAPEAKKLEGQVIDLEELANEADSNGDK